MSLIFVSKDRDRPSRSNKLTTATSYNNLVIEPNVSSTHHPVHRPSIINTQFEPLLEMTDDGSITSSSTTASARRMIFPKITKENHRTSTSNSNSTTDISTINGESSPPPHSSRLVRRSIEAPPSLTTPAVLVTNAATAGSRSPSKKSITVNQIVGLQDNPEEAEAEVEEGRSTSSSCVIGMAIATSTSQPPPISPRMIQNEGSIGTGSRKPSLDLEKQLFHRLHQNKIHNPTIKEFKECWAFAKIVQSPSFKHEQFDLILDVAGGHGALAALLLILTSAKHAVVIDPARVGQNGVSRAWGNFYPDKVLQHRHECLRTGLREELDQALRNRNISPLRILVVACHACQHLSDETLEIACSYGVHVAIMPCCQKDVTGGSWKAAAKLLGIGIAPTMDLLACGKIMSWKNNYQVRMKTIDAKITPQNRIILGKAVQKDREMNHDVIRIAAAHEKLKRAYTNAHANSNSSKIENIAFNANSKEIPVKVNEDASKSESDAIPEPALEPVSEALPICSTFCFKSATIGALIGIIITSAMRARKDGL